MDRKIYRLSFIGTQPPHWTCPTCGRSVLQVKKDTFVTWETAGTKQAKQHEEWDPEWTEYVYFCALECSNSSCGEVVINTGVGHVEFNWSYDKDGRPIEDCSRLFSPRHFQPNLRLFTYPEETPETVSNYIEQSFALFFSNPSSAATQMRIALENLLTHLKVKRFESRRNRRVFLSLHNRIELLPARYKNLKVEFLALKWLGNAGSHANKKITIDDVMDSYEIMEATLRDVFKKKSRIKKLAKKINKKKGPKGR